MVALPDRALLPAGPLSAGHRLGRYEILAKLASGGMAIVYIARAQGAAGFERLVALKVLHANLAYEEEFIRMFLDEARLAASIRHPNVVSTIDISDSVQTGYFLVMEYVEGDHLGGLLAGAHKLGATLPVSVVLRIVADALSGLAAAHALRDESGKLLQLVHRDVSPHNILVGRDGVSRLTDFGVAKAEDRLTHTRDGQVKGKLAYMAPEQASVGTCDARSDLFSMGVILWECLTGRRLFRADNTAATLTKLLHEEIALPSAVDPSLAPLDPVLRRALDRDPASRLQTAEEFIEAIELAARHFGGMASRRIVAKAVKQYAVEKLTRDRKLIVNAQRALRSGEVQPPEAAVEGTPSVPEVSVSSSSSSRSRPSVFSNLTAPALFTRARSGRSPAGTAAAAGTSGPAPRSPDLAAPPPLGGEALASTQRSNQALASELAAFASRSRPSRSPLVVTAALLALLAALVLWLLVRPESGTVTTEPLPALPVSEAVPPPAAAPWPPPVAAPATAPAAAATAGPPPVRAAGPASPSSSSIAVPPAARSVRPRARGAGHSDAARTGQPRVDAPAAQPGAAAAPETPTPVEGPDRPAAPAAPATDLLLNPYTR
jgi:serine/threonine protein kinase